MGGRVLVSQGHAGISADSHPPCISRRGERQWRWLLPAAPPAVLTGLVALLGTLLLAAEAQAQDLAADRAALVALYNATDGPNWKNNQNWLSDEPLDEWYGVTVEDERVTGLVLNANQLTGTIPSELGNLAGLEGLYLGRNRLTGSIPAELGNLALDTLDLSYNQLTGVLPSELGDVANLRVLSLNFNQLTGSIPLSFANLVALDWLRFYMNPGLCAGEDAVIRNWLDGVGHVAGPDCSPSITLSVTPSNLVEGRAAAVRVTASQTPVSNRTSVGLLIGGTATPPPNSA